MKCTDCDHKEVCGLRKAVQTKLNPQVCTFWKREQPRSKLSVEERLEAGGYEDVIIFKNYGYDDALVGVSDDNRAVYDYNKMVDWLVREMGWSMESAVEWIDCNTIRALRNTDDPIIVYPLED